MDSNLETTFANRFLSLLDPENENADDPIVLCRSFFMRRAFHRLIAYFETLPSPETQDIQLQYWYLVSLIKANRQKECNLFLESLSKDRQQNPQLLYIKGMYFLKQLDFQSATDCFVNSFQKNPFFIEPLHKLLSHHLLDRTAFDNIFAHTHVPDEHLRGLTQFASLSWLYDLDEKSAFEESQRLLNENPSSSREIVAFVSSCLIFGKKSELFAVAQRLSDSAPQSRISMFAAGCHMALIGKSEHARSLLWTALRSAPSFAPAWIAYAITHWFDGDSRTALNVILVAARAFPAMELLQIWAARLLVECGETALALAHYKRCRMTGYVYNEIGCILMKQGKIDQAVQVFEKAINEKDKNSNFVVNCANAHRRLGNYERAIELLNQVVEKEPENINAMLSLAFALHLTSNYDDAIVFYNRVLTLAPDNDFAMEMLEDAVATVATNPILIYLPPDDDVNGNSVDELDQEFVEWKKNQPENCSNE